MAEDERDRGQRQLAMKVIDLPAVEAEPSRSAGAEQQTDEHRRSVHRHGTLPCCPGPGAGRPLRRRPIGSPEGLRLTGAGHVEKLRRWLARVN